MKFKRLAAVFSAVLMTLILAFPVFASASMTGASQGTSSDGGNGIFDLLPGNNSLGVPLNEDNYSDVKYIDVRFPTPYETAVTYKFPYTDEFFSQPNNFYSHKFAQGSLGLAVSAFRSKLVNHNGYSDLASYFTSIGFGDIEAEAFKHTPTANSVTYAIASKEIGDQTVIAAICCGFGYEAEWSSNLTIGDGDRHKGFSDAAATVENALTEYISHNNISGRITLWMSGYSRAAAIANLVAADMTDSGPFQKVYCYAFATPATTKSVKDYPNIFNIVGKNDPVPAIPFADWGFVRNGHDLYIPSVQMDSDFSGKIPDVNKVLNDIDGNDFFYNPEFSEQYRTFFDYLYGLIPESSDYYTDLQPGVLQVMANSSSNNILALVSRIVTSFTPENDLQKQELNDLLDYVEQLANQYVLQGNREQIKAGMWNPDFNITQNLTIEHDPDRYVAWMFLSDDPQEIFGQNTSFRQFTVKGKVRLHFYDENGYVGTVEPNGKKSHDDPDGGPVKDVSLMPDFFVRTGNDQLNIDIPCDTQYVVSIESEKDQTITYYASTHSVNTVRSYMSSIYSLKTEPGKMYFLYFGADGTVWGDEVNTDAAVTDAFSGSTLYSPSVILHLQNINFLHLTIGQIVTFLIILILFAYSELIVCATLAFVRIVQGYQRRSVPTIVMHCINAAVFLALEVGIWYFVPAYPMIRLAAKIISFLFIFSLALVALSEHFHKRNLFITLSILLLMALSFMFEDRLIPNISWNSVILKSAFYVLFAIAASLTWLGHTRRRAFKIAEVEKKRYEKKMAKAEKAMQKAYDKSEKATQKYLAKQKKKNAKKS